MFENRSKMLFISAILGIVYFVLRIIFPFFLFVFLAAVGGGTVEEGLAVALIALLVLIPHLVLVLLAIIFNWLAFSLNKRGFATTAGVLYSVSIVTSLFAIFFVAPMIVLCFISVSQMSKVKEDVEIKIQ